MKEWFEKNRMAEAAQDEKVREVHAKCLKLIEESGIPALYAAAIPDLLKASIDLCNSAQLCDDKFTYYPEIVSNYFR